MMREKHPERILQHAVKGMLPRNKLRDQRLARLRVYTGVEHPHVAQFGGELKAVPEAKEENDPTAGDCFEFVPGQGLVKLTKEEYVKRNAAADKLWREEMDKRRTKVVAAAPGDKGGKPAAGAKGGKPDAKPDAGKKK
jgi:hypothetical protein